MRPYDYARRRGVRQLGWDDVHRLARRLAEELERAGVEAVVGIARGGLIPATIVAAALRLDLYPARVSRRVGDVVAFERPVWRVPVSGEVAGRAVAVIDEIADTGETLAVVAAGARAAGASRVVTAALACHTWADPAPDACPLVTDELVIFPWDAEVLVESAWRAHPEIAAAVKAQGEREAGPGDRPARG